MKLLDIESVQHDALINMHCERISSWELINVFASRIYTFNVYFYLLVVLFFFFPEMYSISILY